MNNHYRIVRATCAVALLILLGVSTYTLVAAGYEAFGRQQQKQDEALNARVAVNYITMQIRRHDDEGDVSVIPSPFGNCLVLSEDIEGERYETRIYYHNGYLCERFVTADAEFDADYGFDITELDFFDIRMENGIVEFEVSKGEQTRSMRIKLMSGGIGGER